MVKKHRSSGADRHFRKNQKKRRGWRWPEPACCKNCMFSGQGSGNRYNGYGYSQGLACFNKKSGKYMQLVNRWHGACGEYKRDMNA